MTSALSLPLITGLIVALDEAQIEQALAQSSCAVVEG